jgi:hypothetical protein
MLSFSKSVERFETTLGSGRSQGITSPTTGDVDRGSKGSNPDGDAIWSLSTGLDLVVGTRRDNHYAPLPWSLQADCHKGTPPILIFGQQKDVQLHARLGLPVLLDHYHIASRRMRRMRDSANCQP